mmetsp:Transcript_7577/g.985  ORF Transcript_7577/g.985 Transcript_7577/m.985 type:complete len:129 (+) Transcript_7577:23-409(+)
MLLEDFKSDSLKEKAYYIVFLIRRLIYSLSLVFLYDVKVYQAVLGLSLSSLTILYVAFVQPFTFINRHYVNCITEGVVFFCFCSILGVHYEISEVFNYVFEYGTIISVFSAFILIIVNCGYEAAKKYS